MERERKIERERKMERERKRKRTQEKWLNSPKLFLCVRALE